MVGNRSRYLYGDLSSARFDVFIFINGIIYLSIIVTMETGTIL